MELLLSQNDVLVRIEQADFALKTQQQIEKDFYSSGVSFETSFTSTAWNYSQIFDAVQDQLTEIMKRGETQLLQLLYQIDIPQNQFLASLGESNFSEQLTELIIRREAFKVYLRSKF